MATWKPSIAACSAQIGSISVTIDPGALAAQRLGAALADVAVAADDRDLAADQHVGGPVDAVDQRVPAAVLVVELRLGHRVVDVDRREQQRAGRGHLVQPVHAGGGLLGDAADAARRSAVHLPGAVGQRGAQQVEDDPPLLGVVLGRPTGRPRPSRTRRPCAPAGWRRRRRRGSCSARRRPARSAPARCTTSTPPASRPSRRTPGCPAGRPGCRPGPTTTAAAAWSWVEKMLQLPSAPAAPSATSVSISTAVWMVMCSEPVIRAPRSGWLRRVLLADRHQARHLVLGEPDLLAPELGQRQIGDLERDGSPRASTAPSQDLWWLDPTDEYGDGRPDRHAWNRSS